MDRGKRIKIEKIKIEKNATKKNQRRMERDKYLIKIELLNDLEMKEESETEYIEQLKREIRCLKRANVNAEIGTGIWKKNYKELELGSKQGMLKEVVIYEMELEGYRLKNNGLLALVEEKRKECVGLGEKLDDLSSRKDIVDGELNGMKIECRKLKKRAAKSEEGNRLLCEKEKNMQEEILCLSNVKDKCVQLERKNSALELDKDRLQQELNGVHKDMSDQNAYLREQQAVVCEREKVALNRITDLCEEIQNLKTEKHELEQEHRVLCEDVKNGQDEILRLSNVEDEFVQLERKNRALELEIKRLNKKLIDNMRAWKDQSDENSHVKEQQAPVCKKAHVIRTDSADLSCSEKDVSSNEEENSSTNGSEESQSGTGNGSDEIICKPRNISEGIQHEAALDLDSAAYPKGDKNNPVDLEDGSESDDDLPYQYQLISCKKELQFSSTPKRKWVADTGTSEIRTRCKESKWRSQVDLDHSLEKDPELCLKAVCALRRQQEKKLKQDSLDCCSRRGFSPFDVFRGTELGDFLMDGNVAGDLQKSVEELKMFDSEALDDCKILAKKHSNQLFNIYQAKEDPFFSFSSTEIVTG